LVTPEGDGAFWTVFGAHRLEAAKRAGLPTLKCVMRKLSDIEAFFAAEAENLQRNTFIDPVAEARGFSMARRFPLTLRSGSN